MGRRELLASIATRVTGALCALLAACHAGATGRLLPVTCDVADVAAGSTHSVALTASGTAWTWGGNRSGQLGRDGLDPSRVPRPVTGVPSFVAIACGDDHVLALADDGACWAWGGNWAGQLGRGDFGGPLGNGHQDPAPVLGPDGTTLTGLAAIAAGSAHSLAVGRDGSAWAWGHGDAGQLGDGASARSPLATRVVDPSDPTGYLTGVVAVAAGQEHSLALLADGTVAAWGDNAFGALGNGTTTPSDVAVRIPGLADVVAIAAGRAHSLALRSDGSVAAWGWNVSGQLGTGTRDEAHSPADVVVLAGVVGIAAGEFHSLAATADATWAWGDDSYLQLGDAETGASRLAPVEVTGLGPAPAIAGGYWHSLAVTAGGSLVAWGTNLDGELGTGGMDDSAVAAAVDGLPAEVDDGADRDESGLARPLRVVRDRATRRDLVVSFDETGYTPVDAFRVMRGSLSSLAAGRYDHVVATGGCAVFGSPFVDAGAASSAEGLYYLVALRCPEGTVGSLGRDTLGRTRPVAPDGTCP